MSGASTSAALEIQMETPATVPEVKCVVLKSFGGCENVTVMTRNQPKPGPGQVLIRVEACGMSFTDILIRQGYLERNKIRTNMQMGSECAGCIVEVGEDVENLQVGQRVIAAPEFGAWTEYLAIDEKYVYEMPDGMGYAEGAAIFVNYVSAYILVFHMANLRAGQSILIHSAAGGMGLAIAELCRLIPNTKVFGTASLDKHRALARHFFYRVIDRTADYEKVVKVLEPEGVDVVIESRGGKDSKKALNLLKPGGKCILFGSSNAVTGETKPLFSGKLWWEQDDLATWKVYKDSKSVGGFYLRELLYRQGQDEYIREVYEKVVELYRNGKINPVFDSNWAFEDVPMAMLRMQNRKILGKVIISPTEERKKWNREGVTLKKSVIPIRRVEKLVIPEPKKKFIVRQPVPSTPPEAQEPVAVVASTSADTASTAQKADPSSSSSVKTVQAAAAIGTEPSSAATTAAAGAETSENIVEVHAVIETRTSAQAAGDQTQNASNLLPTAGAAADEQENADRTVVEQSDGQFLESTPVHREEPDIQREAESTEADQETKISPYDAAVAAGRIIPGEADESVESESMNQDVTAVAGAAPDAAAAGSPDRSAEEHDPEQGTPERPSKDVPSPASTPERG